MTPNIAASEPVLAGTWTQRAHRLQKEAHVFYLVFKHPGTHWYARLVAACTAGYLVSPIQLIPNFIPLIGSLDDILVLFIGVKLLQRITPADVLIECRELAEAEMRRKEETRDGASVVTPILIVAVWMLAAITASALMAAYIYH